MRAGVALCVLLCLSSAVLSQKQTTGQTLPTEFEIGRHYFFDFGPPHDFYDVFLVRERGGQTVAERITLTPAADKCYAPAHVEVKTATLEEDIPTLLGKKSPCAIPDKELNRELKRCKKCAIFSGANVTMQTDCGGRMRLIRSDILDRDMFDPAAKTPEHTSWTMRLLGQLDAATGPGVLDRPMFSTRPEDGVAPTKLDPLLAEEIAAGKYDSLFPKAPDKISEVYRDAQIRPPSPTIDLVSSSPITPEVFVKPKYPPITVITHLEGEVSLRLQIDEKGVVINAIPKSGHPAFQAAAIDASYAWRFPKGDAGREIEATIKFALNCPRRSN